MWIHLLILELIDGATSVVVTPPTTPTTPPGGGRWIRHWAPGYDEPRRKKKKPLPEDVILVKQDVVVEKVWYDFSGMVGTVEEVRLQIEAEERRLKARQKRARNKALILMMMG